LSDFIDLLSFSRWLFFFDMVLCCLFSSEHEFNHFLWSVICVRWRSIDKCLRLPLHEMIVLRQVLKDYIQLDQCRSDDVLLWTRWWTYGFYARTSRESFKFARNIVPDNYCWKCL